MKKNKMVHFLLFLLPLSTMASIIHVPGDQSTIQAGIDAASNGDTVLVADSTYTGDGNRDIDFGGKAITVRSENGAENCIKDNIISGNTGSGIRGGNSCVIKENIITDNHGGAAGGGIYCGDYSIIIGNIIAGNTATLDEGGAIYCYWYSSPKLYNNLIVNNSSEEGGGAMFIDFSSTIIKNSIY